MTIAHGCRERGRPVRWPGYDLRKVAEQRSIRLLDICRRDFSGMFWQRLGMAQGAQSCADAKVTDGSNDPALSCQVIEEQPLRRSEDGRDQASLPQRRILRRHHALIRNPRP